MARSTAALPPGSVEELPHGPAEPRSLAAGGRGGGGEGATAEPPPPPPPAGSRTARARRGRPRPRGRCRGRRSSVEVCFGRTCGVARHGSQPQRVVRPSAPSPQPAHPHRTMFIRYYLDLPTPFETLETALLVQPAACR